MSIRPGMDPVESDLLDALERITDLNARITELEAQNTRLLAENSRLREGARYALGGWRENDWPEGFDRGTAEYIADGYRAAIAEDTE